MKNRKKLLALVLSGVIIASAFAGCSNGNEFVQVTTEPTTSEVQINTTQPQTTTEIAVEKEIVSFTDKDKDGNELTMSPIYDKDSVTIVAGYILSAKDKDGKALDSKRFPLLYSVAKAEKKDDKIVLSKDKDNNIIPVKTYSDEKGNMIAIQDVSDLDGDKDTEEYLKITKRADGNGITKMVIEHTTVEVKNEKGKTVVIDDGKKTQAQEVDSKNKQVVEKEKQEVEKNENAKENASKTTTKKSGTTKPAGNNSAKPQSPTGSDSTTKPVDNDIKIVLKKNSQAECSSNSVDISKAEVVIKEAGDYVITSDTELWRGCIKVQLPSKTKTSIKFKDVNISYDTENIIQIINTDIDESKRNFLDTEVDVKPGENEKTFDDMFADFSDIDTADVPEVTLSFPERTNSSFKSTSNKVTGVFYNESKLKIKGKGAVHIESQRNSNNCICSTKSITIENCSVSLATANNTVPDKIATSTGAAKGIFSYGRVTVESGSLDVKSNGDAIRCPRFYAKGGKMNIRSSACDAFDVDSEIAISGGTVNATALKKSCFKVRAVNNNGGEYTKKDKAYTFKISGGTVIGEGSKSTAVQKSSTQPSIRMYIGQYRQAAKNTNKKIFFPGNPLQISIKSGSSTVKTSSEKCTTFLYSSSVLSAENGKYKMHTSAVPDDRGDVTFSGKVGEAFHE